LQFIPNITFKFIKEQFGELITRDPQFNEKEEIKKVEIKSVPNAPSWTPANQSIQPTLLTQVRQTFNYSL
jgi:hypothetical protein